MSTEDEFRPPLRVGGWVPPHRPVSGAPGPLPDSFLPAATASVPEPAVAPEESAPSRYRSAIVTCAGLAVLAVLGVMALRMDRPPPLGTPRFVTMPPVATDPASPVDRPTTSPPPGSAVVRRSLSERRLAGESSSPPAPSRAATGAVPQRRGPFAIGAVIGLEPAGLAGFRVRHRDYRGRVDRIGADSSALDRADSSFTVRAGLADGSCVSFESANYPGHFLRHRDWHVWLDPRDGSALYAADATFCPVGGGLPGSVALRSKNYPDRYLSLHRSRLDVGRRGDSFTVRPGL